MNTNLMLQKTIVYPIQISIDNYIKNYQGIFTAVSIICIWGISFFSLMNVDVQSTNIFFLFAAVILQTFLYTGLFITAHDAMHGAVINHNIKLNHFIGSLSLFLYGGLSYKTLLKKHWQHHQHVATASDPDFHNGEHKNLIAWYFHFMKNYWSWKQIILITITYNFANYFFDVPRSNLTYFWAIPSLLSSLQLFYFGTFIPHSEPSTGYVEPHRSRTISYRVWLSFITCYHFGYHEEHHQCPQVPWWQLPKVHQLGLQLVDVDKDMKVAREVEQVQ